MNRAFLSSAIEGLVSSYGYDFYHSEESHYPTILCRYPAAHLSTPEFVRIEGQKQGRVTYRIHLRLAQQGAKLSPSGLQSAGDLSDEIVFTTDGATMTAVVAAMSEVENGVEADMAQVWSGWRLFIADFPPK